MYRLSIGSHRRKSWKENYSSDGGDHVLACGLHMQIVCHSIRARLTVNVHTAYGGVLAL